MKVTITSSFKTKGFYLRTKPYNFNFGLKLTSISHLYQGAPLRVKNDSCWKFYRKQYCFFQRIPQLMRNKISDRRMAWPPALSLHITIFSKPKYGFPSWLLQDLNYDYLIHLWKLGTGLDTIFHSISLILT